MIINIDNSVFHSYHEQADKTKFYELIEEVCKKRRQGKHFVYTEKINILRILEDEQLSSIQKSTLRTINKELTVFDEGLLKTCKVIHVIDSKVCENKIYDEEVVVDLSRQNFINDIIPVATLILENSNDDLVFSKIVDFVLQKKNLSNFFTDYHVVLGGGHTMIAECSTFLMSNPLTFAICDSDQKSPECEVGNTAKGVKGVFDTFNKAEQYYQLNVHEVENLLPLCILKETARKEQLPVINFLEYSVKQQPDCYKFYDFKEGFKFSQIWNDRDNNVSQFWKGLYEHYAESTNICYSKDFLGGAKLNESDNVIFNRLSSMLPHAISKISHFEKNELTPQVLEDIWFEVGEKLISWFLAPKAINV